MDFARVWLPYLYLYGVGGAFFLLSLVLVSRSGACRSSRALDRRWRRNLVLGLLWTAGLHGAVTLAALYL